MPAAPVTARVAPAATTATATRVAIAVPPAAAAAAAAAATIAATMRAVIAITRKGTPTGTAAATAAAAAGVALAKARAAAAAGPARVVAARADLLEALRVVGVDLGDGGAGYRVLECLGLSGRRRCGLWRRATCRLAAPLGRLAFCARLRLCSADMNTSFECVCHLITNAMTEQ